MLNDQDLEQLVQDIPPLRACLVIASDSGHVHRAYQRDHRRYDQAAQHLVALARAQAEVGLTQEPAAYTLMQWSDLTVVMRTVSANALVAWFFGPDVTLGLARMHVDRVRAELEPLLPHADASTVREIRAAEPALQTSPGKRLLDYLHAHAPDAHAALLRVSLQTGLPLSLLKAPDELSEPEFDKVMRSVQRILGVEQIAL